MTTSKIFKPGELLTAADVNEYLVNDPEEIDSKVSALEAQISDFIAQITNLEAQLADVDAGAELHMAFLIDETTYDHSTFTNHDVNKTGYQQLFAARFPSNIEILYVIHQNTGLRTEESWDDPKVKVEGNTVYGHCYHRSSGNKVIKTLVIFKTKESSN